jgi:hypothetical protein
MASAETNFASVLGMYDPRRSDKRLAAGASELAGGTDGG